MIRFQQHVLNFPTRAVFVEFTRTRETPAMHLINIVKDSATETTGLAAYGPTNDNMYQFHVYTAVFNIAKHLKTINFIEAGDEWYVCGATEKQELLYRRILARMSRRGLIKHKKGDTWVFL